MIVAMAVMHMVQPAIDKEVDMVAVRHRFMAATGAMNMGAGSAGGAATGIGRAHRDHMFIDMITMDMMQMAIVQIIDMAIMLHGDMAAAGAVLVGVIGVGMAGHEQVPSRRAGGSG